MKPALPGAFLYPLCGTGLQRTPTGALADGLAAHYKTVHPGRPTPALAETP